MDPSTTTGAAAPEIDPGPLHGPTSYRLDCVVLDTETTGFEVPKGHRLLEVAMVQVRANVLAEDWSTLVNPGRGIPIDATRVHGITNEMVATAPFPESVGNGLRFLLGEQPLCFHNAPFDLPFMQQFFSDAGAEQLKAPVIDTLGLARNVYGTGKNSLGDLNARLNQPSETAHRALGDARMTARVLILLAGWHERERGIRSLVELAALSQDVVRRTSFRRG